MCVVNIVITVYMYCNYNVITITNVTFLLTRTVATGIHIMLHDPRNLIELLKLHARFSFVRHLYKQFSGLVNNTISMVNYVTIE